MARTSVEYSKWLVFIDGVQVPFIQFSVRTGVDNVGQATIVLEPDHILSRIRAKSMVHIFMFDEYARVIDPDTTPVFSDDVKTGDATLDGYFLFWEGEVRGTGYSKIPTRSYTITAEGCLGIFDGHKIFMDGVGDLTAHPIVNGSALFGQPGDVLFSFMIAGNMFDKNATGGWYDPSGRTSVPFRNSKELNYSERLLNLIVYFSSYNALLRIHAVRTRILNKIASVPDKTLGYMIPLMLSSDFFKTVGEQVQPQQSVLDLLNTYNGYVFHHFVSLTAPHFPPEEDQPKGYDLVADPNRVVEDSVYSIARAYYRNDYVFVPETFYAIPPSCNLIFPEYIRHISVGRDYLAEPTRSVITDYTLGSKLSVVAPDSLLRFNKDPVEPADFWALTNTRLIDKNPDNPPTSPYQVPGSGINLLGSCTDEEIEKGIIPWKVLQPMYLFNAIARNFELDEEGRQQLKSKLGTITKMAPMMASGGSSDEQRQSSFIYVMKTLADFTLNLNKMRRQVSLSLEGNRWLCPGFPTAILDTDVCYLGWVKEHVFSVGPNSEESSEVALDYVRPMPYRAREAYEQMSKAQQKVKTQFNSSLTSFQKKYSDIENQAMNANRNVSRAVYGLGIKIANQSGNVTSEVNSIINGLTEIRKKFSLVFEYLVSRPKPPGELYLSSKGKTKNDIMRVYNNLNALEPITPDFDKDNIWNLYNIESVVRDATREIVDFTRFQSEAADRVRTHGEQHIDELASFNDPEIASAKSDLEKSFDELSKTMEPIEDYPFPPVFANEDLIGVEESEEIYAKILGAQKVFSRIAKDKNIQEPLIPPTNEPGGLQEFQRTAFAKYAYFLKILSAIFPVTSPRSPDMDIAGPEDQEQTDSNLSDWEKESARSDSLDSTKKWEDRTFLRRQNLMSLGQFLKTNGLEMQSLNSDPPTPTSFMVLTPKDVKKVGQLQWDNSIFSKIVDELEDIPRTGRSGSDPRIRELRESVKNPFLTTAFRQARLVKYAKKHFGSRAYDGS